MGEPASGGVPRLADRLNYLFKTVPGPDGKPYTNEAAAAALTERGSRVTRNYLSLMRSGSKDNPSAKVLGAVAELFGVPVDYFFNEATFHRIEEELANLAALKDAQTRGILVRARGLSPRSAKQVMDLLDTFREMEGLGDGK